MQRLELGLVQEPGLELEQIQRQELERRLVVELLEQLGQVQGLEPEPVQGLEQQLELAAELQESEWVPERVEMVA